MIIKRIEGANIVFGAPEDWKDDNGDVCAGLPCKAMRTEQGVFLVSAWEPTPDELERLKNGARVQLWVRGPGHPVVMLDVGEAHG